MGIEEDAAATLGRVIADNVAPFKSKKTKSKPAHHHQQSNIVVSGSSHTIIGNGNTVIVHTTRKFEADVKPGDQHISEKQAARLSQLVADIAARGGDPHSKIWTVLFRRYEITKYRLLAIEQFADAERYLVRWLGRLMPKPTGSGRQRHTGYIKINQRKLAKSDEELNGLIHEAVGKTSLSACSVDELAVVRRTVKKAWGIP